MTPLNHFECYGKDIYCCNAFLPEYEPVDVFPLFSLPTVSLTTKSSLLFFQVVFYFILCNDIIIYHHCHLSSFSLFDSHYKNNINKIQTVHLIPFEDYQIANLFFLLSSPLKKVLSNLGVGFWCVRGMRKQFSD